MYLPKAFKNGFTTGFTSMFTLVAGKRRSVDPPRVSTIEDAWRQVGDDLRNAMQYEGLNPVYESPEKST